jgi:hypothetical protein
MKTERSARGLGTRPLSFTVRHLVVEHTPSFDDGRTRFDAALAARLVGKRVLLGVTYEDFRGNVKRQEQLVGTVLSVHPTRGLVISLEGDRLGETMCLPPSTESFQVAAKGTYPVGSSGEVVIDPDFISQGWRFLARDA